MSSQPGRLSAFGIPNEDEPGPADDIFSKDLGAADADSPAPDQPTETPDPALDQQPETTTVEAEATETLPSGEGGQEAVSPADPIEGTEATPEEVLLAGKYKSVDDLEKGYRESSREAQQIRAQLVAAQREYVALQEAAQAYVASQAQQQQQAPAAPTTTPDLSDAELAQMGIDRPTYQVLKPLVERLVSSQVDPIRAQNEQLAQSTQLTQQQFEAQRAQAEQQAAYANVQQSLQGFYANHPEYAAGTDGNAQLGELISEWNAAWTGDPTGQAPGSFDVSDPGGLEIAAEAASGRPSRRSLPPTQRGSIQMQAWSGPARWRPSKRRPPARNAQPSPQQVNPDRPYRRSSPAHRDPGPVHWTPNPAPGRGHARRRCI
jgi:hypothetical protein